MISPRRTRSADQAEVARLDETSNSELRAAMTAVIVANKEATLARVGHSKTARGIRFRRSRPR